MSQTTLFKTTEDAYQMVTNVLIESLEKGTVPWKKTWTKAGPPQNLSGKRFRGINVWLLSSLNYKRNFFLTPEQVKELGGEIRHNQHGHMVVYTQWTYEEQKKTKSPSLNYYHVYNVDQCSGIPEEMLLPVPIPEDAIEECRFIIDNMPDCPNIYFQGEEPYYNHEEDYITMPLLTEFENEDEMHIAVLREILRSTGNQNRLNWYNVLHKNCSVTYETSIIENLIIDFGVCHLASIVGLSLSRFEPSDLYRHEWLCRLKEDRRIIVYASAIAQQAVEYILKGTTEKRNQKNDPKTVSSDFKDKSSTKRQLKVYRGNHKVGHRGEYKPHPVIRLGGEYLSEINFQIGDQIEVDATKERIIITKMNL